MSLQHADPNEKPQTTHENHVARGADRVGAHDVRDRTPRHVHRLAVAHLPLGEEKVRTATLLLERVGDITLMISKKHSGPLPLTHPESLCALTHVCDIDEQISCVITVRMERYHLARVDLVELERTRELELFPPLQFSSIETLAHKLPLFLLV